MARKANLSREVIAGIQRDLATGAFRTQGDIAEKWNVSPATITKIKKAGGVQAYEREAKAQRNIPPPLLAEGLSKEALERLEDFRAFRLHYFKRVTPTFQIEMANRITDFVDGEILILVPPGHGKSLMISTDYPIWRMIRARAFGERFSCLLVSESKDMGKRFLAQIKGVLESNEELQADYGWFKPEHPDNWTKTQLSVDGFEKGLQKEATFETGSPDSQINGLRLDLIIVDDLVGKKKANNVEYQEWLEEWFHEQVETRLDAGGTLAVIGTRWNMFDFYGRIYNKRDEDTGELIYPTILYRAHDLERCPGGEHVHGPEDEYPNGCILWWGREQEVAKSKGKRNWEKVAIGWAAQQKIRRRMGPRRYDFVYNQLEVPGDDALVQPEWLEACKDNNRTLWHIPRNVHRIVGTIDPAAVGFACAQIWAYDPHAKEGKPSRYLVAIKRDRMQAPEYYRLLREWTGRIRQQGRDIQWFIEKNSANQFLLQTEEFKQLRFELNIRVKPHHTGTNKADAEYGVWSLGPLYQNEEISLPWGDNPTRQAVGHLCSELLGYPDAPTSDCVMAEWFFEWNIRKVRTQGSNDGFRDTPWAPGFLKDSRKVIPISRSTA